MKSRSLTNSNSSRVALATFTKNKLIPDSLAITDASSRLSVGHPSTNATIIRGRPLRAPKSGLKKFLAVWSMALPAHRVTKREGKKKPQQK